MFPSNADIRKFISSDFSDSELETLCFDYFPEVSEEFTIGMTKSQKVLLLIGYCHRRDLIANLMAALENERPRRYERLFSFSVQSHELHESLSHQRNPRQVFICHAHEDFKLASRLKAALTTSGYMVWIAPDSIRPGEKWVTAINRGLEESGTFILLLTSFAVNSKWVRSETDIAIALEHRGEIRFIPLQVQSCSVPPVWRAYQHIPFWRDFEKGWKNLLIELERPRIDTALHHPRKKDEVVNGINFDGLLDHSSLVQREWNLPEVDKLLVNRFMSPLFSEALIRYHVDIVESTLSSLDAPATVVEINQGLTVTQFCVEPGYYETTDGRHAKTQFKDISGVSVDLALSLAVADIQVYTVPQKGTIAIDVPNQKREVVGLRDLFEKPDFKSLGNKLGIGLGFDVAGGPLVSSFPELQNVLLVGKDGSGRSVFLDVIIAGLLLQNTPKDLRLLVIDTRKVELSQYRNIPHLVGSVESDPEQAISMLRWALNQVELRTIRFRESGVTDLATYNLVTIEQSKRLSRMIIIINDLGDLINKEDDDVQRIISHIARKASTTGIHIVASTRRPTSEVITRPIKFSFPTRLVLAVINSEESERVLGRPGAEILLGKGDMIAILPDSKSPVRLQCAYISNDEVEGIVNFWKSTLDADI